MASIDSQNYSPLLEKRNFKDLLEDDMVAVEEDLITKIFSQTVQVSPSDEVPGSYGLQESLAKVSSDEDPVERDDDELDDTAEEVVVVEFEEEVQAEPLEYDKVPADFSHFNQTIVDLDDDEDVAHCAEPGDDDDEADEDEVAVVQAEEESLALAENTPDAIVVVTVEDDEEVEEEEQQQPNEECTAEPVEEEEEEIINSHINTPSTATPVDNDEQSEIRDFEEIERITQVETSPEETQEVIVISDDEEAGEEESIPVHPEAVQTLPEAFEDAPIEQSLHVDVVDCQPREVLRTSTLSQSYLDQECESDVCI